MQESPDNLRWSLTSLQRALGVEARRCRTGGAVSEKRVSALRTPPLERLQWGRRGFVRQPPSEAGVCGRLR